MGRSAAPLQERREGQLEQGQLRRSRDVWYVVVGPDEAWVAIPAIAGGGGGGWFRTDLSLDPASRNWDLVAASEVFALLGDHHDEAAALTAEMCESCVADGLGLVALGLADTLQDEGYHVRVAIEH